MLNKKISNFSTATHSSTLTSNREKNYNNSRDKNYQNQSLNSSPIMASYKRKRLDF